MDGFALNVRNSSKSVKNIETITQLCYNCVIVIMKGVVSMPLIMPIRDMRNTTEISEIAHREQEPIFITKNGYSDLVIMSSELFDRFARINRIDQAIYESEQEVLSGAEPKDAEVVFAELEKKYFG